MGGFAPWHLIVIAIVAAVLFFGWKNLPDMARSAGRSLRVFKTEIKGMGDDDKAREAHESDAAKAAEPKQLAPRPVVTPQPVQRATPVAEVVRNPVVASEPARSRPRPAPSPNGRPR